MRAPSPDETDVLRPGALGLGILGTSFTAQMLPAVPAMSFDTWLMIFVGIPAWVVAIFTLALWYRSYSRKRLEAAEQDSVVIRPPGATPIEES